MMYGIYLSTTGALMRLAQQDNIANNLANANTTAFKPNLLVYRQRAVESQEDFGGSFLQHPLEDLTGGGLFISENATDFSQGQLEYSGQPLDLAIEGKGYFTVTDGQRKFFTRAGNLSVDAEGYLATGDGKYRLVMEGGRGGFTALRVEGNGNLTVNGSGRVTSGNDELGQLRLADLPDSKRSSRVGDNLYAYEGEPGAFTGQVRQGYLELSGVRPATTMTEMMTCVRAYEANIQMIKEQDGTLSKLIERVGAVRF